MSQGRPVELPEGFVDFYKSIESWQNETFFRLKRTSGADKQEVEDGFLKELRQPVIESHNFVVDPDSYRAAFFELARLIVKERASTMTMINRIIEVFDGIDFGEVSRRVFNNDHNYFGKLADENNFSGDLAEFILDHALRPFLRSFALPYQRSIGETDISWNRAVCPVCGFQSNLSWVRDKDGIRFLFCEHCFTEWQIRYLGCTFCGNTEPGSIKYLVIEGDESHQIFVCEKCKGYLKTLDERKGSINTGFFIAGIETVYLDLIAEEEGYTRNVDQTLNMN